MRAGSNRASAKMHKEQLKQALLDPQNMVHVADKLIFGKAKHNRGSLHSQVSKANHPHDIARCSTSGETCLEGHLAVMY